jgi:hypothetical protein
LAAQIKDMERQRDTDWADKEREAAISIQRVRREGFNRTQNNMPESSSSVNARTELGVEMEDGGVRVAGRGTHLHNRHTPKPKSTGRPAQAQAGSWNDIKRHKKIASAKSRTFLHAQVDVNDDGTEDNEDKVMENKRRKDKGMENKRRKPSRQRTDDDDDDDSDSDSDEGDIRLSARKLKKVMADIIHDVIDEKSPRRGRSQSKRSKALRDERKLDRKWQRRSFCVSHYVDGDNLIQI